MTVPCEGGAPPRHRGGGRRPAGEGELLHPRGSHPRLRHPLLHARHRQAPLSSPDDGIFRPIQWTFCSITTEFFVSIIELGILRYAILVPSLGKGPSPPSYY